MRSNKILIGIPISIFLIYIFFGLLATAKIEASKVKSSIKIIPTIGYRVDKILGQPDDKQTMTNRIVANRGFHMGGVHIDSQDRIYVVDAGNNRILGFSNYQGPDQNANIVIGQAQLTDSGSVNTNNTLYLLPTASTLAIVGYPVVNSPAESTRFLQLATDSDDNLYVIDLGNNRVLKYINPFNTDQIADDVWGQPDFISRQAFCGQTNYPLNNYSLCTEYGNSINGRTDQIFGAAVDIDSQGNLWVADTGNHRILRFPKVQNNISKTADLVLGQPDFTTRNYAACWSNDNNNRSKMWKPLAVKVHPVSGEVYVLDGQEVGKTNRILVFTPPFSNGLAASREFGRAQYQVNQPENTTNWIQTDDCAGGSMWVNLPTGLNLARGLAFNKISQGTLWVNDANNNRMILYDENGNMLDIIGQANFDSIKCDGPGSGYQQPDGSRGPLCQNYGEIGVDSQGRLYTGKTYFYRDISRFPLPIQRNADGLVISDGWLLHAGNTGGGWNQFSGKTFQANYGLSFYSSIDLSQLYASDGQRLMVWNNYHNINTFQEADYIVGQDSQDANFNSNGGVFSAVSINTQTVGQGYLWIIGSNDRIFAFQLPITSGGKNYSPNKILYTGEYDTEGNVFWADNDSKVPFRLAGLVFDPQQNALWVSDVGNNRVLRINDPIGQAKVDLVLGQPNKDSTADNAGQPTPNAQGFANPWSLNFDRLGNLYVIDSKYEGGGNNRVLRFNAGDLVPQPGNIFPLPSATGVYAKKNFNTGNPNDWWGPGTPQSPSWVAFDWQNQMIMLVDGYGNDQYQRIFLYPASHTSEQTPQPNSILSYPMGQGASAYFNPDNNHLIIQDLTWNRISFISFPTPTSTPTPIIINRPPIIRTKILLNAYKGKHYQEKIKGDDIDKKDVLTINIANLPPGITQGQCKQDVKNRVKEIVCPIAGKPTAKGRYNVSVKLSDSAGHSVYAILDILRNKHFNNPD